MSFYHEIVEALVPLVSAFEQHQITYYIGGSVSSSVHGIARRTNDVDLIAQTLPHQVRLLVKTLQHNYYVDEAAWTNAVRCGFSYNLLYLQTMTKVDVMPSIATARFYQRRRTSSSIHPFGSWLSSHANRFCGRCRALETGVVSTREALLNAAME